MRLYLLTATVALCAGFAITALLLRPQRLEIGAIDLSAIQDGDYIGVCQNKVLFAVVKVRVQDHKMADIEIVEHKASYMEQAERTARAVCSEQSLEVDAITGATLTSDTVLKAIENALVHAETPSTSK
nr:FMN-binding protein [Clostridium sp. D33t1_170424_F3]